MKYKDIKDFNQRCEQHPSHQNGMVSYQMIQDRLSEEIDELREYIEQRTWVGLTEQQRNDIEDACEMIIGKPVFDAVEAKLKEKNT
jgi:hypothetical protein